MDANQQKREKTLEALGKIKNLPSIPKVVFEVTKLINDPKTATTRLAEVISKDYGLTSKILTVANSPLYGIKRRVSSIEFAILVLGHEDIRNIVTALSIADSIEISPNEYFDPLDFWTHSMLVGIAAKGISQYFGFDFGSEVFVGGILHDLGILVTYKFFKNEFIQIIEKSSSENLTILEAEKEVLGLTHQEVGRFLADKWSLPTALCDTLGYHHFPSKAPDNQSFVAVIHLVDYMTQKLGIGDFFWDKDLQLEDFILDHFNFNSKEMLEDFINEYEEMFKVTVDSLKI